MDVSFIIPVYNGEKYLQRCLNSILKQSFSGNFEVIIVDDCSTDNTLVLIEEYKKKDNRVEVIRHSVNKKVSQARYTGFLKATGDYIWYIDADDWIADNVLQSMYDKAIQDNLDVLLLPMRIHFGVSEGKELVRYKKKNQSYYIPNNFVGAVVCKFIKRTCINSDYITFTKSFGLGEDFLMAMELFYNISKVDLFDNLAYFYFVNVESSTQSSKLKKFVTNFLDNVLPLAEKIKDKYNGRDFTFYNKDLFNSGILMKILEISKDDECRRENELKNRLYLEGKRYVNILGYKGFSFHKANIIKYRFKESNSLKMLLKDIYRFIV